MDIIKRISESTKSIYPIEKLAPVDDILFIDIETTGFTARSSKLYLIGCVYYKDSVCNTIQFFADNYDDESEILSAFFEFSKDFKVLIHFNGNNFDIPYLEQKAKQLGLPYTFDTFVGIDIYKRIAPLKKVLMLENCKQKTIERFLGVEREDKYSGGDLIGIYNDFVTNQDAEAKRLLLLHNFDDICGMVKILPILAYSDLFVDKLTVSKVSANYFTDVSGTARSELLMAVELSSELVTPVSFRYDQCYFTAAGSKGMLRVPLFTGELKYFYANYKDYYYLPAEDVAIHKSVAEYVDKNRREQAKASNCYTRRESTYIPQWDALVTPFFKPDYNSGTLYWELTDERRTDRELFSQYVTHVLEHFVRSAK